MYFLKRLDFDFLRDTFQKLFDYQAKFDFSNYSREYQWSSNPLLEWSRCYEYPFVYESIHKYARDGCTILDYGSGKNFLPFLLCEEGYNVTCYDVDDYSFFYDSYSSQLTNLSFTDRLGARSERYDVVYSVSVLEHTGDVICALDHITGILADYGLLILTLDVDVRGDLSISMDELDSLSRFLWLNYESIDVKINTGGELLTYQNSPYGYSWQRPVVKAKRILRYIFNNLTFRARDKRWFQLYDLRVGLFIGRKRRM